MFNLGLYKEGLRKTKVLAILFLAAMLLGAIFQPIGEISDHINGIRRGWRMADQMIHVYGLHASYMMVFALFVGAPILTLSIFSFLNKRNSSDFYHAIPHKREALFGSFIAAVLTWVIGGMWLATAISVAIYAPSAHTVIHLSSILLVLLGISAACLLVISATALAITVTGTRLSNIITAGLILFLPRLLMSMFIAMIIMNTGVVTYADFGLLGNFSRHIPIGFLTGGGWQNNESIHQMIMRGTLYTFILAVIYLVAAGYLFKKRHSELAGNPGSKWTQPIIRVAVTFTMTLPVIAGVTSNDLHGDDLFFIFLFYLIAIVGYFAYEFLTTKKLPKFLTMLPGLGVVAILNVIFIFGIIIGRGMILQEVNIDNISSITVVDLRVDQWSLSSYAGLNARGLEISDPEITQFLGETLNDNIRASRRRLRGEHLDWWSGTEIRVTFNIDGGRNITRRIRITEESRMGELLPTYEPYQALYLTIPEDFDNVGSGHGLTREEINHVLDVLRAELPGVDFPSWYRLVGRFACCNIQQAQQRGWITLSGTINGYYYHMNIPMTEVTPRALELYLSFSEDD